MYLLLQKYICVFEIQNVLHMIENVNVSDFSQIQLQELHGYVKKDMFMQRKMA